MYRGLPRPRHDLRRCGYQISRANETGGFAGYDARDVMGNHLSVADKD